MAKYFLALLMGLAKSGWAQYIIELAPLTFTPRHSFRIESVEDLRSVKKSIGQVQKGMFNSQLPAAFENNLDIFLKKDLNETLGPSGATPVYLKVKTFWISEETYFAKEIGKIESEFEVYQETEDGMQMILNEKFNYQSSGADVTKRHSNNIYRALNDLLARIDVKLLPSNIQPIAESDTIADESNSEAQPEVFKQDERWNNFKPRYDDVTQYGGPVSLGIAIGGAGILGIPLRVYPAPKLALEVGGYLRPFFESRGDELTVHSGMMLAGGMVVFADKFMHRASKAKLTGVCFKGGHSFGNFPESFGAIGYSMEKIDWEGKSFSVEVGLGVIKLHSDEYDLNYALTKSKVQPVLYFKVHWAWYLVKNNKGKNDG